MSILLALLAACTPAHGPDTGDSGPSCVSGEVSDHQGIEMAYVCPGSFTMGSPEDEVGRGVEEPQHEVTLTRGFYLSVTEITQQEHVRLTGYYDGHHEDCGELLCAARQIYVSEAFYFANMVSEAAGLEPCYACTGEEFAHYCRLDQRWASPYDCPGYRVPTEAEWEYAARAGTTSAFSNGGNLLPGGELDCEGALELDNGTLLDDIAVYCAENPDRGIFDLEVATREPNPWGLYDMHGNMAEWTGDEIIVGLEDATDPWNVIGSVNYVYRGGSDRRTPRRLRSAYRGWLWDEYIDIGIRLARSE